MGTVEAIDGAVGHAGDHADVAALHPSDGVAPPSSASHVGPARCIPANRPRRSMSVASGAWNAQAGRPSYLTVRDVAQRLAVSTAPGLA